MFDPSQFRQTVRDVARQAASKYPSYVDPQDIEQELYLWLYSSRTWIQDMIANEPEEATGKVTSMMRKAAFDLCNKEKAAAEGYHPSDVFRYSAHKITKLLPDVLDYEDWQSFGQHGDGQPTGKAQANTTGDRIVEIIDIKGAIENLSPETYALIKMQYQYHCSWDEIAEALEIQPEAAKKRGQRAIKAIQKELGYKAPDELAGRTERRTVRSNSAWRADQSWSE